MDNLSHKGISALDLSIALCVAHSDLTMADALLFEQPYNLSSGHDVHEFDEDEDDEDEDEEDFDEDEEEDEEYE